MLRIEELRREQDIGQKSLAQDLRVSQPTISHWENGTKLPTLDNAIRLADIFDVSLDYLVGRDRSKKEPAGGELLSEDEKALIELFRSFAAEGRKKVIEYAKDLDRTGRYSKSSATGSMAKRA